jgi:hypothetical protein
MKTLAELRLEVELGLKVYPDTNYDVFVFFDEGWYIFARSDTPVERESSPGTDASHGERVLIGGYFDEAGNFCGGGVIFDDGYKTFDDMLADWPYITSQPIWSTTKTPGRIAGEKKRYEKIQKENEELAKRQELDMLLRRVLGIDPLT